MQIAIEQNNFSYPINNPSFTKKEHTDTKISGSSFKVKDPWSAFTHFIGFVASLTAAPFLLHQARIVQADALTVIGCVLFILGLTLLYGASTAYHTFILQGEHKNALKKYDHMMIFVLIAGSYSPFCLHALRGTVGTILFIVIWSIALLGMIFKFCWVTCPKWVSSVLYIGMGWAVIFTLPQMYQALSSRGFWFLVAGGIAYTIGGVIYAIRFRKFNEKHPAFGTHEIFHVFCLIGSLCHFITVFGML